MIVKVIGEQIAAKKEFLDGLVESLSSLSSQVIMVGEEIKQMERELKDYELYQQSKSCGMAMRPDIPPPPGCIDMPKQTVSDRYRNAPPPKY